MESGKEATTKFDTHRFRLEARTSRQQVEHAHLDGQGRSAYVTLRALT